MTLYVIRSAMFGSLTEATTSETEANIWRDHGTWTVEEQPDATPEEQAVVAQLNDWLLVNYSNGAHWIYETTEEARHVAALRAMGGDVQAYRASLERQWEATEDYAEDIRNA